MKEDLSDGDKKWVAEEVRRGNGTQESLTEIARHSATTLARHEANVQQLKDSWKR